MVIHPNDILELFEKEKRPILEDEVWRKFGIESVVDFENTTIVPDDEARDAVSIYIWVRTSDSTSTQRKEPYKFHPDMLEEFWLNEILYILKNNNDEVDLKTIIEELGQQVVNYYGLSDPLGKSFQITSDAGLGKEQNARLLKFFDKHKDKFYVRQGKKGLRDAYIVGLVEWKDKVLENDRKIIRNAMIKVLRDTKGKSLSLKDLTFAVNRIKLETLTPKPFNEELIKQIVIQNSGRLVYDISKDAITLSDDLEYITNYFKENRQHFNEFNFPQNTSGFLAWVFIGNDFPMKEAIEYVKTRPIIFIDEILDRTSKNILVNYKLIEYLKAVMDTSDDEEIKTWLSENVILSYYEEGIDQVKLLSPKIIEKFSPIFNTNKNPGNLFQYTLESKLEEYYEKNPQKD